MTADELYEHLALIDEYRKAKETLNALELAAKPGAQALTGMPHSSGVSDMVGFFAVEIADLKSRVDYMEATIKESIKRIDAWTQTITETQPRTAFRARYLLGLEWKQVAPLISKTATEASVRSLCNQYLKKNEQRQT